MALRQFLGAFQVLSPPHENLWIYSVVLSLNVRQELIDLVVPLGYEAGPEFLDEGFFEEQQTKVVFGLVEEVPEEWLQLGQALGPDVGAHIRQHALAPEDAVRAYHHHELYLATLFVKLRRQFECACEEQALVGKGLRMDRLVYVWFEGALLQIAPKHAQEPPPNQVLPVS